MAKDELWRGQQNQAIRSRFFGTPKDGEKSQSFSDHDQKTLADLEQRDHQFSMGKPSTQERMAQRMQKADEGIRQRVEDALRDEELNPTPEQDYVARLVAFDRQMGLMPEKPRSQVEKLANAITREFNLNGQESTEATTGITVNPEVLLTNTTKDLLKTFTPENILVLAPLTLALMVVRAMPPEVKATLKHWYEKMPANTRRLLVLMMATVILAGCSAMAGTPNKEVDPGNNNDPVAGETAGAPSEEVATEEVATEEAATEEPLSEEEQQYQDIAVSIQEDPFYNTAYVQAREATNNGEIPEACVAMIKDLVARQEIASAETLEEWGINSNGDCYIRWTEKGITTIVFGNKDTNGYLYVRYNPSEHPEGSVFEYKDTESGFWATVSVDGKVVRAVDGRTSQWVNVIDGQMMDANGQPTPIPTMTPINADPNETRPAIKMIDPEAIAKLVEDYRSGNLTDLSSLNEEQRSAFDLAYMASLVEDYFNDNYEAINRLNFEGRKAFAIALDAEKDARRGENPIIYTGQVHKLDSESNYIDPITGDYLPVDNGTTAKEQTIDNTKPIAFDDEGFAHVFYNGEWIKLEGSQNIQFDNFENFKWPNTEIVSPETLGENEKDLIGLTVPEAIFKKKDGFKRSMAPIFFLEEKVGQAIVFGVRLQPTIHGFILNQNDPYSAELAIVTKDTSFYGNDMIADYLGSGFSSKFFENLKLNTLYYIMYETDQKASFARTYPGSADEVTENYSGLVPSSQTSKVITGELDSDDVIMINGLAGYIVEPGRE